MLSKLLGRPATAPAATAKFFKSAARPFSQLRPLEFDIESEASLVAQHAINTERQYCANYYMHVPAVIERGERIYLYDVDNKKYFDFICGFASVNQGHCHPRLVKALSAQAQKVTQFSRCFFGPELGNFAKYLCDLLGY